MLPETPLGTSNVTFHWQTKTMTPVNPPPPPRVLEPPCARTDPWFCSTFPAPLFLPHNWVFHGCGGCRAAIQVCRTAFHVCCLAIHAFGTQNETHGAEFEVSSTYLLLYLFFRSLLCTIGVSMYTAREVVCDWRSDGTLVPATVLGPGAQFETVHIEYKRNEHLVKHPAASIAHLSHPIPVVPDSPEWGSSSTRSPSRPPRTRPVEPSAE